MKRELVVIRENVCLTAFYAEEYRIDRKPVRKPAVIICPGGGWFSLSEREGEPVAINFVQNGYQAFVLNYSINENQNMNSDKCTIEEALEDIEKAYKYLCDREEKFLINKNLVTVLGFSAGGQLAALFAARHKELMACVLSYSLLDYNNAKAFIDSPDATAEAKSIMNRAFISMMNKENCCDQDIKEFNPIECISRNMPPVFIWHGREDELIPPEGSLNYARVLGIYKIDYELHIYSCGKHGLSLATPLTAAKDDEISIHCSQWFSQMLKWLEIRRANQ